MKEIKTEIIINATSEQVWQVLLDFEKYPEWNPFIKTIKGKPLAKSKLTAQLQIEGNKPMTIKPVVTISEKNKKFEWFGTMPLGMFNGRHYFMLEELGDGMVKFTHGEYFTGWLAKPILKKVEEKTRDGFIGMNRALKARVER